MSGNPILKMKQTPKLLCCAGLICVLVISIGCADIVEPIVYAKRGGMSPATEDATTIPFIDRAIRRELAGEKPLGAPTWRAYWHISYAGFRANISRGYSDDQRFIDYVHQQRAAVGLPLYDDQATSTKRS